ncbi:MAG: ammonium transporter [Chlorobia bacterium]|nr:ammonium transporter [Fimbriimonadaceae bacterium]
MPAWAQDVAKPVIDKGDSAWLIVATALVLLMTPALALFYGGMVQKKNVLNTMLLSFAMMGVVSIVWVLVGYSLAFGKSSNGLIGSLEYLWGQGISVSTPYGTQTIPAGLFMLFQMKFAIITPALISGAVAERIKFSGYLVFMTLWSIIVYAPIACWVWNADGWLFKLGALDFAGGTVVHLASGVSALALCYVLGKRAQAAIVPNNITLTLLGAGMLWFGWFGFNAGSALAMNEVAITAFITTHLAAAAGMLAWMLAEYLKQGKASVIGAASGLVAGLVGITPAAGYVGIGPAILIGIVAGAGCYFAISFKHKLGYDDALDVVAVHGFGGLIGAILTGVFASPAINPGVVLDGGRGKLILNQLIAVGAVAGFALVATLIIAKLVQVTIGLRVSPKTEEVGLDKAIHGESGYGLDGALVGHAAFTPHPISQEAELVGAN